MRATPAGLAAVTLALLPPSVAAASECDDMEPGVDRALCEAEIVLGPEEGGEDSEQSDAGPAGRYEAVAGELLDAYRDGGDEACEQERDECAKYLDALAQAARAYERAGLLARAIQVRKHVVEEAGARYVARQRRARFATGPLYLAIGAPAMAAEHLRTTAEHHADDDGAPRVALEAAELFVTLGDAEGLAATAAVVRGALLSHHTGEAANLALRMATLELDVGAADGPEGLEEALRTHRRADRGERIRARAALARSYERAEDDAAAAKHDDAIARVVRRTPDDAELDPFERQQAAVRLLARARRTARRAAEQPSRRTRAQATRAAEAVRNAGAGAYWDLASWFALAAALHDAADSANGRSERALVAEATEAYEQCTRLAEETGYVTAASRACDAGLARLRDQPAPERAWHPPLPKNVDNGFAPPLVLFDEPVRPERWRTGEPRR